jgi:hypothetical protein
MIRAALVDTRPPSASTTDGVECFGVVGSVEAVEGRAVDHGRNRSSGRTAIGRPREPLRESKAARPNSDTIGDRGEHFCSQVVRDDDIGSDDDPEAQRLTQEGVVDADGDRLRHVGSIEQRLLRGCEVDDLSTKRDGPNHATL